MPIHLLVDSTGLKLCGPGEWLIGKHATQKRRSWKKLHVGVDAQSGRIVAARLTDRAIDDAAQIGPLLNQVPGLVAALAGDGTYDRVGVYAAVYERHIQVIAETGRMAWQRSSGYNQRAKVEGQIGRWKQLLGRRCASTWMRRRPPRSPSALPCSTVCLTSDARTPIASPDRRWGRAISGTRRLAATCRSVASAQASHGQRKTSSRSGGA